MAIDNENFKQRSREILEKVFSEPATPAHRPLIVEYVTLQLTKAKELNLNDRYSGEGFVIAADLLRMLALQGILNGGGYDWVTEEDEPILFKMQYYASLLDESPDKPEAWKQLLNLTKHL